MKTSLSLARRFASTLAVGCAFLTFVPAPQAMAQKKIPPAVPLTPALLDKVEKVSKVLSADTAAAEELKSLNHEKELDPTVADTDDAIAKKYPHLAAIYVSVGLKPHEFVGVLITLIVSDRHSDSKESSSDKVGQANIDFVKANQERVSAILKIVTGE